MLENIRRQDESQLSKAQNLMGTAFGRHFSALDRSPAAMLVYHYANMNPESLTSGPGNLLSLSFGLTLGSWARNCTSSRHLLI